MSTVSVASGITKTVVISPQGGGRGPQGIRGAAGPAGPGVLVLNATDIVPAGTPVGTVILRRL